VVFECPLTLFLLLAPLSINRLLKEIGFMSGSGNVPVWSRVLHPQAGNWHYLSQQMKER